MIILYNLNSGNPGGLEYYTLDLVKGMSQKGHKVYVWCRSGEIVNWYKNAGAEVTEININKDIDFEYIRKLRNFITEKKVDIVHTSELKAGINALIAAKMSGVKIITHIHTPISEWKDESFIKTFFIKLESILYSILVDLFSNKEIALTESRRKKKIFELILPGKLKVIPNGFDLSKLDMSLDEKKEFRNEIRTKYQISEQTIVVGCVGRMTAEKGHEYLIRAFAQAVNKYPKDMILFLAGGGDLEEKNRKLAVQLGIADKVIITGVFPDELWKKIYCVFDIYVFPSVAEGFGYVLVESMYLGIPVICSDLTVLKEVGGNTVEYFKRKSVSDLTEKILASVVSFKPENTWNIGESRMRVINEFSMLKFINNYNSLYLSILKK